MSEAVCSLFDSISVLFVFDLIFDLYYNNRLLHSFRLSQINLLKLILRHGHIDGSSSFHDKHIQTKPVRQVIVELQSAQIYSPKRNYMQSVTRLTFFKERRKFNYWKIITKVGNPTRADGTFMFKTSYNFISGMSAR